MTKTLHESQIVRKTKNMQLNISDSFNSIHTFISDIKFSDEKINNYNPIELFTKASTSFPELYYSQRVTFSNPS